MKKEAARLAAQLWSTARRDEQAVQVIADDDLAVEVREQVRRLARTDRIRVRTARLADTVVVVRLDAQVWQQDVATMRHKLTLTAQDRRHASRSTDTT